MTYYVPIHFISVDNSSGTQQTLPSFAEDALLDRIDYLNSVFTNDIEFYLCNFSRVNSDTYRTFNYGNESQGLYNFIHDENSINIYMIQSYEDLPTTIKGVAQYPWDNTHAPAIFLKSLPSNETVAHEMGHFLGIAHTYEQGVAILPDNSFNPNFNPDHCYCCDCNAGIPPGSSGTSCQDCNLPCSCNGDNSGDFISDTPPDNSPFNAYTGCQPESFTVPILGGQTATYTPDKTNLMSNYELCRNSFTPLQLDRMFNTLLLYSNRSNYYSLTRECLVEIGNIHRIVQTSTQVTLDNFADVDVYLEKTGTVPITCNELSNITGEYEVANCVTGWENEDIEFGPLGDKAGAAAFTPSNGVTVLDIIAIQRHSLAIEPLPSPYPWIAADVNNSGSITILDVLAIRELILNNTTALPVPSWRYVPDYALNPKWNFEAGFNNNPFTAVWNVPDNNRSYNGSSSYLDPVTMSLFQPDITQEDTWSWAQLGFVPVQRGEKS